MQTTANYGFKKPDGVEIVNIDDLNYNADVADAELKKRALQTDLTKTQEDFDTHMADTTAHGIGDKTKLNTTAKNTIVAAINEVFQSGTSVKSSTISAVNSKGGNLSTSATWDQIIAAINSIARGQGNAVESQVLSGVDFSNSDGVLRHGSMPNNGGVDIIPSGSVQTIAKGYHDGSGKVEAVVVPVANVLSGTTIAGQTGSMKNNGVVSGTITNQGQSISIPEGYIKGGSINANFENLTPDNVKENIDIGGITGALEGKQNFFNYLFNNSEIYSNYYTSHPLGFENEGLWWGVNLGNNGASEIAVKLYNKEGTILKTLYTPVSSSLAVNVTNNYILWITTSTSAHLILTDKNGTIIANITTTFYLPMQYCCFNKYDNKIYICGGLNYLIYNLSGTLEHSGAFRGGASGELNAYPCSEGVIYTACNLYGSTASVWIGLLKNDGTTKEFYTTDTSTRSSLNESRLLINAIK